MAKARGEGTPDLFRRRLHPRLAKQWEEVKEMVNSWVVSDEPDQVVWNLGKNKRFTTKAMYNHLESRLAGCNYRWIWKAKLPLKIQIFLWQLFQNAVLTRDVMKKRNWAGNTKCSFCQNRETSQHLFFTCPVARVVWRTVGCVFGTDLYPDNLWQYFSWCYTFLPDGARFYTVGLAAICWAMWICRNRATFECKKLSTPFDVVFSACAYMNYWVGLMVGVNREAMERGAKMLKTNAAAMMRICAAPAGSTMDWRMQPSTLSSPAFSLLPPMAVSVMILVSFGTFAPAWVLPDAQMWAVPLKCGDYLRISRFCSG